MNIFFSQKLQERATSTRNKLKINRIIQQDPEIIQTLCFKHIQSNPKPRFGENVHRIGNFFFPIIGKVRLSIYSTRFLSWNFQEYEKKSVKLNISFFHGYFSFKSQKMCNNIPLVGRLQEHTERNTRSWTAKSTLQKMETRISKISNRNQLYKRGMKMSPHQLPNKEILDMDSPTTFEYMYVFTNFQDIT